MEAIGAFGQRFDFVIDSFHSAIGDRMLGVGQNAGCVGAERFGHFEHLADTGLVGLGAPIVQEGGHGRPGGLAPEFAQLLFEIPAQQEGFVKPEGFVEFGNLLRLEVLGVAQEQKPGALDAQL